MVLPMLSNSFENLFGGVNKIIAEKLKSVNEGCQSGLTSESSVSDVVQKPKDDEEQLNEIGCDKMKESNDYKVFMSKNDWDSKIKDVGLDHHDNGVDHIEAKDTEGNIQGWWNGHTGVGYLHKHCCEPVLQETNDPSDIEESQADPLQKNTVGDSIVSDQPIKN